MEEIMKSFSILFILFCVFNFICAFDVLRGVDPSNRHLYGSSAEFKCRDGSAIIPFDRVNDDYCDCSDGSDEPGTSACPNGVFFCLNEGYKTTIVPSSRVGDGVCDCCDGSDEYTGLVKCVNDCVVLGQQLRAAEEKKLQLLVDGYKIYKEYSIEGTKAKLDKKAAIVELEAEKENLEVEKEKLESIRKELEVPEEEAKNRHKQLWEESKERKKAEKKKEVAAKAFAEIDVDLDGVVSLEEMQMRSEFDIDNNGEVSPEEAKEYMEDQDELDFDVFYNKVWGGIEQIFKSKVQVDEAKPAEDRGDEKPNEEESTTPAPPMEDDDERNYDNEEDEDDEELEVVDHDKKHSTVEKKEDKVGGGDDDDPMPPYDEATQNLIKAADGARSNVNDAESKLRDVQSKIEEARKIIDSDFGPDNQFYTLRDQCFDWTDREYTYKLCPFERASQRNKNGGSETTLGRWSKWSDGDDSVKYSVMYYEHGQNCWNGPDRSTKVILECGTSNELTSASEPNRCEYQFTFSTPAACTNLSHQSTTPRQEL